MKDNIEACSMYVNLIPRGCVDADAFFEDYRLFLIDFSPKGDSWKKSGQLKRKLARPDSPADAMIFLDSFSEKKGAYVAIPKNNNEKYRSFLSMCEKADITYPGRVSKAEVLAQEDEGERRILQLIITLAARQETGRRSAIWPQYIVIGEGKNKGDLVCLTFVLKNLVWIGSQSGFPLVCSVQTFHPYRNAKKKEQEYLETHKYARRFVHFGNLMEIIYEGDGEGIFLPGSSDGTRRNLVPVFDKKHPDSFDRQKYGQYSWLYQALWGQNARDGLVGKYIKKEPLLKVPAKAAILPGGRDKKAALAVREKALADIQNGNTPVNVVDHAKLSEKEKEVIISFGCSFSDHFVPDDCNISIIPQGKDAKDAESDRIYKNEQGSYVQHITKSELFSGDKLNKNVLEVSLLDSRIKQEIKARESRLLRILQADGIAALSGKKSYIRYHREKIEKREDKENDTEGFQSKMTVDYDTGTFDIDYVLKPADENDPALEMIIEEEGENRLYIYKTDLCGVPDLTLLNAQVMREAAGKSLLPCGFLRKILENARNTAEKQGDTKIKELAQNILETNDLSGEMYLRELNVKTEDGSVENWQKADGARKLKKLLNDISLESDGIQLRSVLSARSSVEQLYPYFTGTRVVEDYASMCFYYFVGDPDSTLPSSTPRGIIGRKCVIEDGFLLDPKDMEEEMQRAEREVFSLLPVTFVRSKQYITKPLWAKYLDEIESGSRKNCI